MGFFQYLRPAVIQKLFKPSRIFQKYTFSKKPDDGKTVDSKVMNQPKSDKTKEAPKHKPPGPPPIPPVSMTCPRIKEDPCKPPQKSKMQMERQLQAELLDLHETQICIHKREIRRHSDGIERHRRRITLIDKLLNTLR